MSPPDRAAVEALISDSDILYCQCDEQGMCDACDVIFMLRNLLQRLELAEQEKAEAQRDEAVALVRSLCDRMNEDAVRDGCTGDPFTVPALAWLAAYDAKESGT
jgi:hypothetical protein